MNNLSSPRKATPAIDNYRMMVRVDNTDHYEPGSTVYVGDVAHMVVWILNENDLSVVRYVSEVMH